MKDKLTVSIIGLGLIGGSLAFALKDFQNAKIIGSDINPDVCKKAVDSGAVSSAATDPMPAIKSSDLVIFCVYPEQVMDIVKAASFKPGAVVTEVCGVKAGLTQRIAASLPKNVCYVPCHPMAGKEVGGFENAAETLFLGAGFIITPSDDAKPESIELINRLAKHIGASKITCCSAAEHDKIIAYTSHLCHLSAVALCLNYPDTVKSAFLGGSFRDCTRVANINPTLWSSLFTENKVNVLNELTRFQNNIEALKQAIENEDDSVLVKLLSIAKANKATMSNA